MAQITKNQLWSKCFLHESSHLSCLYGREAVQWFAGMYAHVFSPPAQYHQLAGNSKIALDHGIIPSQRELLIIQYLNLFKWRNCLKGQESQGKAFCSLKSSQLKFVAGFWRKRGISVSCCFSRKYFVFKITSCFESRATVRQSLIFCLLLRPQST